MTGLGVIIYTDELRNPALAIELRRRSYDATRCHEAGRNNQHISDRDQLTYAAHTGRAILTSNVRDFIPLDARWKRQGRSHAGIVIYAGVPPFGDLLRRVIRHLDAIAPETQHDTVLWLPQYGANFRFAVHQDERGRRNARLVHGAGGRDG